MTIHYGAISNHPNFGEQTSAGKQDSYDGSRLQGQGNVTEYKTCDVPEELIERFRSALENVDVAVNFSKPKGDLTNDEIAAEVRAALDAKLDQINASFFASDELVPTMIDGKLHELPMRRFESCSRNSTIVQENPRVCISKPGQFSIHLFLDCAVTDAERMVQALSNEAGVRAKGIESYIDYLN